MNHLFTTFSVLCARVALGMMVSLPFLQPLHSMPIPSFFSEWLAVILGLMASLLCLPSVFSGREHAVRIPFNVSLPLALLAVVVMQVLLGKFVYLSSAAMVVALLLWACCVMLACSVVAKQSSAHAVLQHLAKCLMVGALLSAIVGVLQSWGVAPYLPGLVIESQPGSGVYGNLAQQNHFATYLACGLAASLYLFRQGLLRWHSMAIIGAVLLLALLLSGSRSVILYLLVCAVWLAKGRLQHAQLSVRYWRRIVWLALIVFLMALVLMLNSDSGRSQIQRYGYWSETIGARVFLWKHAFLMWMQAPLIGVGWDSFADQLVEQIGQAGQVNRWGVDQYAHNLFLQLAAVAGLVGVLALVLPLASLSRRLWRAGVQEHQLFALVVLAILGIHSLLEQPLYYSYFLGLAACMLVCVESGHRDVRGGLKVWIVCAMLVGGVLLGVQTLFDYRALEGHFVEEGTASSGLTEEQIIALHERSFFSAIVETLYPQLFVPHTASAQAKLALNTRLMRHAPVADTEFRQAALLAEAGEFEAALRRLKTAAYAYPEQLEMYAQRYTILSQSEPEKYAALAKAAHELMPLMVQK
ncbi:MAG: O-antigen ligase C-terminal domain-containing protein [Burkholderiales bacterium]|nr:O-antigen ligase C-terminal domain-containing protein [Burkholderiales bacterium]